MNALNAIIGENKMVGLIQDWSEEHTDRFEKDITTFKHSLNETGLFSDDALIKLLEKHPSNMLDVCTMGDPEHPVYPNRFRTGDFRDVSGKVILDAAKAGKVWINVRKGMNLHPEYKAVLDRMYGDLGAAISKKPYDANGGILISSPIAQVPYHFDKTHIILWHVRGKKRIYIYPQNEKFIPDRAYEAKMLRYLDDDLPYTLEFDEHAEFFDLEEAQAIAWPLNSPHRVDNREFCVSVTTEYSTAKSRMKNSCMVANATLRHWFGIESSYSKSSHVHRQLKSIFGYGIKKVGLVPKGKIADMVTFKIDPSVRNFIVDIEPYQRNF